MSVNEWKCTSEFINTALMILEVENPMTVRQLFYRLVSAGVIENTRGEYQRVSRLMTKARRDDRCRYEWLVDRTRPTYTPSAFEDPAQYAECVKRSYRKDYWAMQPNYCEIWCEKDAVVGSIEDCASDLGVTLRVSRGFISATRVNDIAQHFIRIKKPVTVFYLGDHDPSGQSIQETADKAVTRRMAALNLDIPLYEIERLAIHAADIAAFNLPPLRVKESDSRAAGFIEKHGDECVELDALPPTELRSRIQNAVNGLKDQIAWDRAIAVEKVELASIVETASKWNVGAA